MTAVAAKPFAPDDPFELVGTEVPADAGALEEMAQTFVEEYLRAGWSAERLLALFRNPFFRAPHMVYRMRGEEYITGLIAATAARWSIARPAEEEEEGGNA